MDSWVADVVDAGSGRVSCLPCSSSPTGQDVAGGSGWGSPVGRTLSPGSGTCPPAPTTGRGSTLMGVVGSAERSEGTSGGVRRHDRDPQGGAQQVRDGPR